MVTDLSWKWHLLGLGDAKCCHCVLISQDQARNETWTNIICLLCLDVLWGSELLSHEDQYVASATWRIASLRLCNLISRIAGIELNDIGVPSCIRSCIFVGKQAQIFAVALEIKLSNSVLSFMLPDGLNSVPSLSLPSPCTCRKCMNNVQSDAERCFLNTVVSRDIYRQVRRFAS